MSHDGAAHEYTKHLHGLICMNKDCSGTWTYEGVLQDGSDCGGDAKAQGAPSPMQTNVHAAMKV